MTPHTDPCPDDESIVALLDGTLVEADTRAIQAHLDGCVRCREFFADLTAIMMSRDGSAARTSDADESHVVRVGRYELHERLGAGAMGVVYRAWDPELCRDVALKILRPDRFDLPDHRHEAVERLLREARACAALQHPHIVTVYDVGRWRDDNVFMASALIRGETARQWARGRSWRAVLEVYVQIAEALAQAHRAGLVHRDVKPENILVDEAAHAYLVDFGLVHATSKVSVTSGLSPVHMPPSLTMTGAVVGTPAYMSPEQLDGQLADAQVDLYALCISIYEAIYGFRPYAGSTLSELVEARRRTLEEPRSQAVPARVHAVLERALRPRVQERFKDADSLIEALLVASREPRRTAPLFITGTVVIAAILGVMYVRAMPPEEPVVRQSVMVSDASPPDDVPRAPARVPVTRVTPVEVIESPDMSVDMWDAARGAVTKPDERTSRSSRPPLDVMASKAVAPAPQPIAKSAPGNAPLPRFSPDAYKLNEACMRAALCTMKSSCIPTALAHVGAHPITVPKQGTFDLDESTIYHGVTVAMQCAYEARQCDDTSTLFWALNPDNARHNYESEEKYRQSRAAQYGSTYPECPIGTPEIDTPALQVSQLKLALGQIARGGLPPESCVNAWTRFSPKVDELIKLAPDNMDDLDYVLQSLIRCLVPSHCDMAEQVWARFVASDPSSHDYNSGSKMHPRYIDQEGEFAYRHHGCYPTGKASSTRGSWIIGVSTQNYSSPEMCATDWERITPTLQTLSGSELGDSMQYQLLSMLSSLTQCLAPSRCDMAHAVWAERDKLGVDDEKFEVVTQGACK